MKSILASLLAEVIKNSPTAAALVFCFLIYRQDMNAVHANQIEQAEKQTAALVGTQQAIAYFAQQLQEFTRARQD